MEAQPFLEKVHSLSDLELAALICLVANQHCIIKTEEEDAEVLVQELQLVRSARC
jgi:hypothetical protein